MKLPEEIKKKVKLLDINTRKLVNNLFAGQYHTMFKGQGMTFADFREYVPGDDVRSISWPLTARTGKPFIKKYDEERELTLMLAVDVSGSSDFGTGKYFKGEVINYLSALLSFSAERNNDQIGLLLFSDQVELYLPPNKGKGHVYRMLRELLYFKPRRRGTRLSGAFDHLTGVLKKRSTVFVFSDFIDEGYHLSLRRLGSKHEVIAVVIEDPAEQKLPSIGVIDIHDAETGELVTIDTSSIVFQRDYHRQMKEIEALRDSELKKSQVDRISIVSGENYIDPLIAFFKRRKTR